MKQAPNKLNVFCFAALLAATSTATASAAAVPADTPRACESAVTQAELNACAHDEFLVANGSYAEHYKRLSDALPTTHRERLRRVQKAWLNYRTAACRFESGPVHGGSVYDLVYWRCAARMTRERSSELERSASCREGDITCRGASPQGSP